MHQDRRQRLAEFVAWTRPVPNHPRYVVLCNFDEFWVYDFDTQIDTPKHQVGLTELPDRWGPLAFLFPTNAPPTFNNDREAIIVDSAPLARDTAYRRKEIAAGTT